MSYQFDLNDFAPDLEEVNKQYPDREGSSLDKWPLTTMKLPGEYTVRLGRGSVRFQDRDASKPGTRTYDASISTPAIVEIDGVKYSSFISWYTGSPIGLKEFVKLLTAFGTADPVVAAIRLRNAVIKGWFKNYHNNGFDNLSVSNFTVLEAPGLAETNTAEVKITDNRAGASTSSGPSAPAPGVPTITAGPAPAPVAAAPVPSVQAPAPAAADKPFWEQ